MGKTDDVREAVEAELAFDPLVDPTDITVMNMDGNVALNGTVPSYPQYLEAGSRRQRHLRGHLREPGEARGPRPYLGRARRGG